MKVSKYFIGDLSQSPHNAKQSDGEEVWIVAKKTDALEQYSSFIDKIFAKTPWKDSSKTFISAESLAIDAQRENVPLILLFGPQPKDCGLQCSHHLYRPLFIADRALLFAQNIDILHDSVDQKKKLWAALQLIMNRRNT